MLINAILIIDCKQSLRYPATCMDKRAWIKSYESDQG
jgi:hypothetical protein